MDKGNVDTFNIRVECFKCDSVFLITVIASEYKNWQDGMLIQEAMPNLSKDNRELLISQTCAVCFANLNEEYGSDEITWPDSWEESAVAKWWRENYT